MNIDIKELEEAIKYCSIQVDLFNAQLKRDGTVPCFTTNVNGRHLCALINAAKSYAAQQWQDISTAPRDGTEIQAIIRGCDTGNIKRVPLSYSEDGWLFDGSELSNAWDVIKWQPLPPAPVSEES